MVFAAVVIGVVGLVFFTTWGKAEPSDAIQSIAVLPFVDESSDPDAQYINDKIAESLINSLSVAATARRAAQRCCRLQGQGDRSAQGRSGIECAGRGYRTDATARRHHQYPGRFDRPPERGPTLGPALRSQSLRRPVGQDDISRDIFENLRLKLNVDEKKQLEAYGLYLKGRNAWNKRTGDALPGDRLFQPAIKIDPNNSASYAGLADCYNMLVVYGRLGHATVFRKRRKQR